MIEKNASWGMARRRLKPAPLVVDTEREPRCALVGHEGQEDDDHARKAVWVPRARPRMTEWTDSTINKMSG